MFTGAEQRQQPVEAPPAGQHRLDTGDFNLEDEARVIVERTTEGSAIADRVDVGTGPGKRRDTGIEADERLTELEAGFLRESARNSPTRSSVLRSSRVFASSIFSFSRRAMSSGERLALVE